MELYTSAFLSVLSIQDLRNRKISVWIVSLAILGSVIYSLTNYKQGNLFFDILPGCILCVLARLSSNQLGVGDGLVVIFYGLIYGWEKTCNWLMISFFLASVVGVVGAMSKKWHKIQIPFIPFLTLVHIGMSI